jgi:hypothetical protein
MDTITIVCGVCGLSVAGYVAWILKSEFNTLYYEIENAKRINEDTVRCIAKSYYQDAVYYVDCKTDVLMKPLSGVIKKEEIRKQIELTQNNIAYHNKRKLECTKLLKELKNNAS